MVINLRLLLGICLAAAVVGCTKSDNDENSSSGVPDSNACSVLGLNTRLARDKDEGIRFEKIINGTECASGSSPVVNLTIALGADLAACTGTLITPTQVLTAAHCFLEGNDGVQVSSANGQATTASRVTLHPRSTVNPQTGEVSNDVAVVQLRTPLNLPTLPIFASRSVEKDDVISIFGYGQDESGNLGDFRSGEMQVTDVRNDFIVSIFGTEGSNTCFGDSGGPALLTATRDDGVEITGVVGVTSAGTSENCGLGDNSSFTNLQSDTNLDFIRDAAPGVRIE